MCSTHCYKQGTDASVRRYPREEGYACSSISLCGSAQGQSARSHTDNSRSGLKHHTTLPGMAIARKTACCSSLSNSTSESAVFRISMLAENMAYQSMRKHPCRHFSGDLRLKAVAKFGVFLHHTQIPEAGHALFSYNMTLLPVIQ